MLESGMTVAARTLMEVSTPENGIVALDAARHALPDVVVTDLGEMPVMDGLDLWQLLERRD